MNNLLILSFLSLKKLVSELICINNSVITLVDKRPKNRLQVIFYRSRKVPRKLKREVFALVTVEVIDGTFIYLISEFSQTICS